MKLNPRQERFLRELAKDIAAAYPVATADEAAKVMRDAVVASLVDPVVVIRPEKTA